MALTAYGENAEAALDESATLIKEVESLWSVTDQESKIYRANHSGTVVLSAKKRKRWFLSLWKWQKGQMERWIPPSIPC